MQLHKSINYGSWTRTGDKAATSPPRRKHTSHIRLMQCWTDVSVSGFNTNKARNYPTRPQSSPGHFSGIRLRILGDAAFLASKSNQSEVPTHRGGALTDSGPYPIRSPLNSDFVWHAQFSPCFRRKLNIILWSCHLSADLKQQKQTVYVVTD